MNLILIGAQGSGKGTQSKLLAQQFGVRPCSSGDLLRAAIAEGSPLGREVQPYLDRGDLVPDELVIALILEQFNESESAGLILDGFPRTLPQARKLDERLAQLGQSIERAIFLDVPRELLMQRLEGRYLCRAQGHLWNIRTKPPRVPGICDIDGSQLYQRTDDTTEKITHRLDIFFRETIQLVEYYDWQDKLLRVDGTRSADVVSQTIVAALRGQTGEDQRPAQTA